MKKSIFILAGSAILTGAAIVTQTTAQTPPESKSAAPAPETDAAALTRGAKAWANNCSRCHNLRSPSELNAELWDVSVMHMRVRANLPGDVADDIKLFLMSSAQSDAPYSTPAAAGAAGGSYAHLKPGNFANGGKVYSQTCIACHGVDGKGTIDGVPDFTAANGRLVKPDEIILTNIINGYQSEGSLMAMPPLGGNSDLAEQDMADVLTYIRKEFEQKQ